MDVHIYQENTRKVKGEDVTVLLPIGVLEGFEDEETALEALIEADDSFLGVELVIFTQEPTYITAQEPTTRYSFARRNGSGAVVEAEEAEPEYEEEPEAEAEEEAPAPTPKRKPKAKAAAKRGAHKPPPKVAPARPASKAAARAGGGGRRSPFTKNAASAD